MTVGLIIGTAMPSDVLKGGKSMETIYGSASSPVRDMTIGDTDFSVINRHGIPPMIPPHSINHKANIHAMKIKKVDCLISVCSCGALHGDIEVPSFSIPDDYVDLFSGFTFHNEEIVHVTPVLNRKLSDSLAEACRKSGLVFRFGGTYVQTTGPRLETRAEISVLSKWGDYVGMNLGPEATLAIEAGIPVASLLTVDNYAHGISEPPDYEILRKNSMARWSKIKEILSLLDMR